jgi:hypothetical protein
MFLIALDTKSDIDNTIPQNIRKYLLPILYRLEKMVLIAKESKNEKNINKRKNM